MESAFEVGPESLVLDHNKLSSDNAEVYLLQWLARCEAGLAQLPPDDIKPVQSNVESTLVEAATATPPFPEPGRPTRHLVARCFIQLFLRSETRSLLDVLQKFARVISDVKMTNSQVRICALYVTGELMCAFGTQFKSFIGETANLTLRLIKNSSTPMQVRYHAFSCLSKSLQSASRAVPDIVIKDIVKQAKVGLSEKSMAIQRASVETLKTLYRQGRVAVVVNELESIVSICSRGLDTADSPTRISYAELVSYVLTLTQTETAIIDVAPTPKKKKNKTDKPTESDDEPTVRTASNAPSKTLMTLPEALNMLSASFVRQGSSSRTRAGVGSFYAAFFTSLGPAFIESHYPEIVQHLLDNVIAHPRNNLSRQDVLLARNVVQILLRDVIGVRMLSEQGQIGAIRELSASYLRKWPAVMPGQKPPNPKALLIALNEISGLLYQLGNAPPPVQDALSEPLIELLSHPNHSTKVAAAGTLRVFCYSTPLRLAKAVISVMDLLTKDITSLAVPGASIDARRRIIGHAHGLAALFSVIPQRPLYVSYDLSAKILDTAIQLLKRAVGHDTAISGVEIETAWICISSLMTLGPNFVRGHLSQLLVLWRNALPKPTSKDGAHGEARSHADWAFLLQVRESALSAILNFLVHNLSALVTLDVARRLSSLLSNALNFANAFVAQHKDEMREAPPTPANEHSLSTREAMLRRRVFQCFSALGFSSLPDATQIALLDSSVNLFASADGYLGSSAQAAIASSSGAFTAIWQSTDGYAYGVTSLDARHLIANEKVSSDLYWLNRDSVDIALEKLILSPILGAREHDTLILCREVTNEQYFHAPPTAATGVVDAAIELFAQLLPIQNLVAIERIVSFLIDAIRSPTLERNPGRKSAALVNVAAALFLSVTNAMRTDMQHARETFGTAQISSIIGPLLQDMVTSGDPIVRSYGTETLGRLASLSGTSFISAQITSLVDAVVNNRDPNARAGCSMAFGAIHSHVGGMAAGPLLKTTVNVLMSLSNDPHPTVHFHALTAMAKVINSASLSYSVFISSTLAMLIKLYMLDSHEPEGGTLAHVNSRGDLPAYQVMCRIIDAVIGVLGPELQESAKTRSLTLDLVNEFSKEVDDGVRVEAIKCTQHLLIFGSQFMPVPTLVTQFRTNLSSSGRPLKMASINVIYALVQKDAFALSKIGGDRLVEDLFGMLDDDASVDGVRSVITSWLLQTVKHGPSGWIDLCQRIMSRTNAFQQASNTLTRSAGFGQDDEGEALSVGMSKDQPSVGAAANSGTSRWRTQLFALKCLHLICTTLASANLQEHVDLHYARSQGMNERNLLVSRVPDLVKMAFTASAAYVTDIRLEGLTLLRDIITIFAQSPDADYPEALLLEQYQAPITSALTPAFSPDSTPEILGSAIETCAVFVGCGVIKDAARMGRILKLLTTTLEQCRVSDTLTVGDAQELSPNASVMLRVATLAAWADLETSSVTRNYLTAVLKPYREILSVLWVASLRDYATIRADSEVLQEGTSASLDMAYTGLGREVLLPYYATSWVKILQAVASTMQRHDQTILAAMDGLENPADSQHNGHRPEGCALYPVILGLVFETLSSHSNNASSNHESRLAASASLKTLCSLVRPEYSGNALFEALTFTELTSLFYRLTLTEPADLQILLIEVVACLINSRDGKIPLGSNATLVAEESPLSHCLRICAYAIKNASGPNAFELTPGARTILIKESFMVFMRVSKALAPSQREDARALAVVLYADLLKAETNETDLVGPSLSALKAILEVPPDDDVLYARLVHALLSTCLQNIDELSGRQGLAPTLKIKNNLLASVLVVTVVPQTIKLSQAAVEYCCYLITQKLGDSEQLAVTAAHCTKTLILAAAAGAASVHPCIKLLAPGMVSFLVEVARHQERSQLEIQSVDEILKAFTILFNALPEGPRATTLAMLVPVLVQFLDPIQVPPSSVHSLAIAHLVGYASSAAGAFKDVAGKLNSSEKETLEVSVRQAVGHGGSSAPSAQIVKRQISLRTF